MTFTGTSNSFFLRVDWLLVMMPNGFRMKQDMKNSHCSLAMAANAWTCILMLLFFVKVLKL